MDASGPTSDPRLAALLERCVLAYEDDGDEAVERLLAADPDLARIARERFAALREAGFLKPPSAPQLPERIGAYRVISVLGGGGMGVVFLAEQEAPIRRRVALKLVKQGIDTREVLARFELERRALALLDHPHIAKIHEAGSTESGQPYFAMEYVAGAPITEYCREKDLAERQRVELFALVCDTVQHAHQRGILHRDLKPSNILVAERDGAAWPMLIDFGFAKALEPIPDLGNMHTERGRVLGTPEYMSPEQAAYRSDLDTRSDVYSLGVVLYELVTGALPIASARLRGASPSDLERILREEHPRRPSKLMTKGRSDLDWIVMKALEKDPARRYGMAADLAADLRRFLVGDAVLAGPPSGWYRFHRLVRKHRAAATATGLILLAIVAGLVVSILHAAELRVSEQRATAALASAERSLAKALEAADELLIQAGGTRLRAFPEMAAERRALLESGLRFCDSLLVTETAGHLSQVRRAQVHLRVANFLIELARTEDALDKLAIGVQLVEAARREAPLDGAARVLEIALHALSADTCTHQERWEEAIHERREALRCAQELAAVEPGERATRQLAGARVAFAWTIVGAERDGPEVTEAASAALESVREVAAFEATPDHQLAGMLAVVPVVAWGLTGRGNTELARSLLAETERVLRRLRRASPDDATLLEILGPTIRVKGVVRRQLGELDAALEDLARAETILDGLRKKNPADVRHLASLAGVHEEQAIILGLRVRYPEAIAKLEVAVGERRAVAKAQGEKGTAGVRLAMALAELASAHVGLREYDPSLSAEPGLAASRDALEILDRLEPAHQTTPNGLWTRLRVASLLATDLLACGDAAQAERVAFAALPAGRELVARHGHKPKYRSLLAEVARVAASAAMELGRLDPAREAVDVAVREAELVRAATSSAPSACTDSMKSHLLLACIELERGALAEFERAWQEADRLVPASVSRDREVARALAATARRAVGRGRALAIEKGLAAATRALDLLEETMRGTEPTASPSYLVTRAGLLDLRASLLETGADFAGALHDREGSLACHEEVFAQKRGHARDRERLRLAFAALLQALEAHGTPERLAACKAKQAALLGL